MNYNNSIIYKLCCRDPEITDIYVGSTTNFRRRKWQHKSSCSNVNDKNNNIHVYQFIRENGGFDAWDMVQVEQYEAKDKHDLHARERHWIETLKPSLNRVIPTRTVREYYNDNKQFIMDCSKNRYDNNKNQIQAQMKQYYEKNKQLYQIRSKQYYENNKEAYITKSKQYYEDNKDQILAKDKVRSKIYREKNRTVINEKTQEKRKQRFDCECGWDFMYGKRSVHEKSKMHQLYNFIYL
jgi:hypothetical protein